MHVIVINYYYLMYYSKKFYLNRLIIAINIGAIFKPHGNIFLVNWISKNFSKTDSILYAIIVIFNESLLHFGSKKRQRYINTSLQIIATSKKSLHNQGQNSNV